MSEIQTMNILWVAAENGALTGGKVGGIGDVVHQLPKALAQHGCRVRVITPSHGFLHRSEGAVQFRKISFLFRGYPHEAEIFEVPSPSAHAGIRHLVVHHPLLISFDPSVRKHRIYTHDPPDRPFFIDATRFAFFCKAVAAAGSQNLLEGIDCVHLHDWHAAHVALLCKFHPEHGDWDRIRMVYSIHNLAFQGIRPLRGSESSLEAWFPEMRYDWFSVADPRWPDTVNPTAAAIRLADAVHTVSPTYAAEIQKPSRKPRYFGGEGLEADLQRAAEDGRLTGILNGCDETPALTLDPTDLDELLNLFKSRVIRWSGRRETVASAQFVAYTRLLELGRRAVDPEILLTGVFRVGEQKMLILRAAGSDGRSGLESLLEGLGDSGLFLVLGEGDPEYERFLVEMSARFPNFLFLNGYSETCASALYAGGDLFLMPSSFEPCGLSQMLALRNGQPCLVHAVGGLKDTIREGYNGFVFQGDTLEAQVDAFVQCALKATNLKKADPDGWQKMCDNAAASRFSWHDSALRYIEKLYTR